MSKTSPLSLQLSDGTPVVIDDKGNIFAVRVQGLATIYKALKEKAYKHNGPKFVWNGGRIPLLLWRKIVSFMHWSYVTHKSEALVQLYYNQETHDWAAWAFPQSGVGMTVQHITQDPRFDADRAQFPHPWVNFGSVHHHCTGGAFASGVDKDDEQNKEGLHITIGHMDKGQHELHFRVTYRKEGYDTELHEWFDFGQSESFGDHNNLGKEFAVWALKFPYCDPAEAAWIERFSNVRVFTEPRRQEMQAGWRETNSTGMNSTTNSGNGTPTSSDGSAQSNSTALSEYYLTHLKLNLEKKILKKSGLKTVAEDGATLRCFNYCTRFLYALKQGQMLGDWRTIQRLMDIHPSRLDEEQQAEVHMISLELDAFGLMLASFRDLVQKRFLWLD